MESLPIAEALWDYPSAGLSRTRWFVAANDFGGGGAILSIDKAASLTGGSVAVACFNKLPFNLAPPIVLSTSAIAQFLSPGSGGGSAITRLNLAASPSGVAADTVTPIADVDIPAWITPPPAAQPNGQLLDTLDGRFQSASIQSDGLIWNVHSIGLGGFSKIRLYKISTSSTATLPLSILTPTTAVGENLFNASFATGSGAPNAPAFMTASRTIPTSSTLGRATFLMFVGLNSSASTAWSFASISQSPSQFTGCARGCRWGDYSATQVDPSNSGRAWGFNQIATGTTIFGWTMIAGQISAGFLDFPLHKPGSKDGVTPFTIPIISVVDHSGTPLDPDPTKRHRWYYKDSQVTAYSGERGASQVGCKDDPAPSYRNIKMDSHGIPLPFVINGHYIGSKCAKGVPGDANTHPERFLNYDGHSGFDYGGVGTQICAPADGILTKAKFDNVNHNCSCVQQGWDEWHSFYIDHSNGYSTWYLHVADGVKEGSVHKGDPIATMSNFGTTKCKGHGVGVHLHFEVRKGAVDLKPKDCKKPDPIIQDQVVDPYADAVWTYP